MLSTSLGPMSRPMAEVISSVLSFWFRWPSIKPR